MKDLPTGTVTFLFTDIEGSTALLQRLTDAHADVLMECRRLVRAAVHERGGQEVGTQGDAVFAAFPSAREAVLAAVAAQKAILHHPWPSGANVKVRMGLHTGEARVAEDDYVGLDVHRTARICAAGHGGQILLSDAVSSLAARDLPPGVSLRDLGTHHLKDLKEPEHLFQVTHPDLHPDFPPLKSLDARLNNLPLQLTSFIGRDREIAEVTLLLSTARLITLTGFAGVGKTRLALQVAADLIPHYLHGVWVAELGALSDPALVPKAVAMALDVPEQPGRAVTETLKNYLRAKTVLVILDNCEHLVSACAELADALLRSCPNLRILATSRESLGLSGEVVWRVPVLSAPTSTSPLSVEQATKYDAVRLFVDRAALSHPGFCVTNGNVTAVAQVAHRLEGIPLAIELAASRVKALPVEVVAAKLDDRYRLLTKGGRTGLRHQQTLRATLDWSFDLLAESERTLLRRLSVFAGGFTVEAAEAVCARNGGRDADILDRLTSLVDKSLVVFDESSILARYRLLETVRQYGVEKLQSAGEVAEVRRRHRDWFLALAEQAEPELRGPKQAMWYDRLETEHDNLRAALQWTMTEVEGRPEVLRLTVALSWFWRRRGYWSEAYEWTEEGLKHSHDAAPTMRAKALAAAATLAWRVGKDERAIALAEEGLAFSRRVGEREEAVWCLMVLGWVARQRGDSEQAKRSQAEALSLSSGLDKYFTALALNNLGSVTRDQGDYEQATALHEQALAMVHVDGGIPQTLTALILTTLGMDYLCRGDYRPAAHYYAQSLSMCKTTGDRWVPVLALYGLGAIACIKQLYERAARLFGAGNQLNDALGPRGYTFAPSDQECYERYNVATRARLGEAAFAAAWAEGRAMTLEQAIEYALGRDTA